MKNVIWLFFCIFSFYIAFNMQILAGNNSIFYKEVNLIGGYSDSAKWLNKTMMLKNSIGAEYYRKLSGSQGDYMTLDLQSRLTFDFSEDFKDAWELEIHNAWLEYKLGLGYKLRLGHFDPFFGLEPILDTHGTLLQTIAHKNIGYTSDWGLGFIWLFRYFDYEYALQLGTGMGIKRKDDSFLFTQRIGMPQEGNLIYGLSILYGRIAKDKDMSDDKMDMSNKAILKKRIGIDIQYPIRSLQFKGEIAYGKNDENDVLGTFLEIDYTLPFIQALEFGGQWQRWQEKISDHESVESAISMGLSYKLTSKMTLRTAYFHNFNKDKQIFIQIYYYGT